ncbi:hypothetical protein JR316_0001444 [Psilocybe cubensis]|uniref:Uncharacterized protein n=2 Tax=Psilocybe cubensis TaxID=181762 RepID=A0A8H7Y8Q7_PSICU|nr:hypothetical protein JR316_0001444 [Psilocybe cubensis]KAH9487369.1 hypothetical protein JR316_0001444 [Psilocybe cubensis]
MADKTVDITALSSFKSEEEPMLTTGISTPGCTWIFTYEVEKEQLSVQWERKSAQQRNVTQSSKATVQVFLSSGQTHFASSSPYIEYTAYFLNRTGADVFKFPKPRRLRGRWIFFKVSGPPSILGIEPSEHLNEIDEAIKEMDALRILIKKATDDHVAEVARLNSSLSQAHDSVKGQEKVNARLLKEIEQLQKDLDTVDEEYDTLQDKFRTVEASNKNLETEKTGLEQQVDNITAIKQQLDLDNTTLQDRVKLLEGTVADLQKRDENDKREIATLKGSITSLETNVQNLETTKKTLDKKLAAAQRRSDSLQADVSSLTELKESFENKISALTQTNIELSASNMLLTQKNAELIEQVDKLEADRSSLVKEARDAKVNAENAQRQLQKANMDVETTKSKLEAEIQQASDLQSKYTTTTLKIEHLENDLAIMTEKQRDSDDWRSSACQTIEQLQKELQEAGERELNYDPNRLYKQLDEEKKGRAADIESLSAALEEQKELSEQKTLRISDLESEAAARLADIRGLEKQIGEHLAKIATMEAKICQQANDLDEFRRQLAEDRAANNKLQAELNDKISQITVLENQQQHDAWVLQGVRNDLATAQGNLQSQQRISQNLQCSLYSEQNTSSSLRGEAARLQTDYNSLYANYTSMQKNFKRLSKEYDGLSERASHEDCVQGDDVLSLVRHNNHKLEVLRWQYKKVFSEGRHMYARMRDGSRSRPGSVTSTKTY